MTMRGEGESEGQQNDIEREDRKPLKNTDREGESREGKEHRSLKCEDYGSKS